MNEQYSSRGKSFYVLRKSGSGVLRLARRFAYCSFLSVSIFAIATPCFAECDSARVAEKAQLQEYLQKELNYKVAKFRINWIDEKRTEFGSSDLLASERAQAQTARSQLELEVEQSENAYHEAKATREAACE